MGDMNSGNWLPGDDMEAWWHRGNTFASHHYGLGSTLGCMWDVFHSSQPMPGGFPLGVFFHPLRNWNRLIRPTAWPELVLGDVKSTPLPIWTGITVRVWNSSWLESKATIGSRSFLVIFTDRIRSMGNVMFSQTSVILSTIDWRCGVSLGGVSWGWVMCPGGVSRAVDHFSQGVSHFSENGKPPIREYG